MRYDRPILQPILKEQVLYAEPTQPARRDESAGQFPFEIGDDEDDRTGGLQRLQALLVNKATTLFYHANSEDNRPEAPAADPRCPR